MLRVQRRDLLNANERFNQKQFILKLFHYGLWTENKVEREASWHLIRFSDCTIVQKCTKLEIWQGLSFFQNSRGRGHATVLSSTLAPRCVDLLLYFIVHTLWISLNYVSEKPNGHTVICKSHWIYCQYNFVLIMMKIIKLLYYL